MDSTLLDGLLADYCDNAAPDSDDGVRVESDEAARDGSFVWYRGLKAIRNVATMSHLDFSEDTLAAHGTYLIREPAAMDVDSTTETELAGETS